MANIYLQTPATVHEHPMGPKKALERMHTLTLRITPAELEELLRRHENDPFIELTTRCFGWVEGKI